MPIVSETVLLSTEMPAGVVELLVGVKVAVRVRPVKPAIEERVPPETVMSWSVNVLPGSSEKVKVMVAVSPIFKVDLSLLMATDGAMVSTVRER